MSTSLRTLKGVGEKTEKLFSKIGVTDVESLLSYYPRNYDAYEEPVEIKAVDEGSVVAISGTVVTGVYVNQVRNLQVITTTVADLTGRLSVTWFNAPYLRSTVRKGCAFILRGRIARKQGKLQMEHPEIFTPAAYEEILHSLQPIYGLTSGLSNKTIVKLLHQVLKEQNLQAEYLADEYKEKYHLADRNFAVPAIHFPKNMQELLSARRRLVFDEFLLFILAVQRLKEKTEEAPNEFPMHPVWTTEKIIEDLPYDLTKAQLNVWHEIERENLLPSEKAYAYKMKMDAVKHQGIKDENAASVDSADLVGQAAGDSGRTVQRYIRLTCLIPELLKLLDEGKINFTVGVSLTYLSETEQIWVKDCIVSGASSVTGSMATKLKQYSDEGNLTELAVQLILNEKKTETGKVT